MPAKLPISNPPELVEKIWTQKTIPAVLRPEQGGIVVKLPNREDDREWLKGDRSRNPTWDPESKAWIAPAAWYDRVLKQALERYRVVYTIRPPGHRVGRCTSSCQNAKGSDCECPCEGQNHGCKVDPFLRWNRISASALVPWYEDALRCTVLVPPDETVTDRRARRAMRLIDAYGEQE